MLDFKSVDAVLIVSQSVEVKDVAVVPASVSALFLATGCSFNVFHSCPTPLFLSTLCIFESALLQLFSSA